MPKLWMLSDLHLECYPLDRRLPRAPEDFDVLVVAGDIWESCPERAVIALRRMAGDRPVVAVLGNHDYWGLEIDEAIHRAKVAGARHDVHVLDGDTVDADGVIICGATLWPDLDRVVHSLSPLGEPIRHGGSQFRLDLVKADRKRQIAALEASGADLIVTHYPAGELQLSKPPRVWLSGHEHSFERSCRNGTEYIRNPRQARVFADVMVVDVAPSAQAVAPSLEDERVADADLVM